MVSPLWTAASEGDVVTVSHILSDAASVDIEIRDQNGSTPLLQAVKNGHFQVVKLLLENGANPAYAPGLAQPENITSDSAILALLSGAKNTEDTQNYASGAVGQNAEETSKNYYPSPSDAYPYFPTLNSAPPQDGMMYYPPPPQPSGEHSPNGGLGNLPPPDVARLIPCRYFPACRYGPTCMFAHPQTPYFQGALPPPAQYSAPYDSMAPQPYPPSFYGTYPPTNGVHPMSPTGVSHNPPHPGVLPGSEVSSPPPAGHFSPSRPPMPYPPMPSGMSPSAYTHPGQAPIPMSLPPLPPLHHPNPVPAQSGPQSPSVYTPPAASFPARQNNVDQYPTPATNGNVSYPEPNGVLSSPAPPASSVEGAFPHGPAFRDGPGHNRRASFRRGSFGGARRPPCLFFPSGKCKNGDDCRFPHILNDSFAPLPHHQPPFHPHHPRGGPPRARGGHMPANNFNGLADKFNNMAIRDGPNGVDQSHRPMHDHGARGRFHGTNGFKHHHANVNGAAKTTPKIPVNRPQRVPQADEFPALGGTNSPRARSPGGSSGSSVNGSTISGPTAAQVLQRPAPAHRDSGKEFRAPASSEPNGVPIKDPKPVFPNGEVLPEQSAPPTPPGTKPVAPSFASIASPASSGPHKAVSVSVSA